MVCVCVWVSFQMNQNPYPTDHTAAWVLTLAKGRQQDGLSQDNSILGYFNQVTKPYPYLQGNGDYTEPYGLINDSLTSAQPIWINPRSLAICFHCSQTSVIFVYCTTKHSFSNCKSANSLLLCIWKAPFTFLSQKKKVGVKYHNMYFSLTGDFSAHCLLGCRCRGPLCINQCREIKDCFITQ